MVFVFLDTNVLNDMCMRGDVYLGEYLFDNYMSEETAAQIMSKYGERRMKELSALRDIIHVARRGSLPLAVSSLSHEEFLKTPQRKKREELVNWGLEMLNWWESNRTYLVWAELDERLEAERIVLSGQLNFLPDTEDRLLVAEALVLGCDTFLTLDRKTILRHRKRLAEFDLEAVSPLEFVQRHQRKMVGA